MPENEPLENLNYAAIMGNIQAHRDTHRRLLNDLRRFEPSRCFLNASLASLTLEVSANLLAAAEYFLEEDDTKPDFHDYDGFDNDLEVFKLVAKKNSALELLEGLVNAASRWPLQYYY